MTEQIYLYF